MDNKKITPIFYMHASPEQRCAEDHGTVLVGDGTGLSVLVGMVVSEGTVVAVEVPVGITVSVAVLVGMAVLVIAGRVAEGAVVSVGYLGRFGE